MLAQGLLQSEERTTGNKDMQNRWEGGEEDEEDMECTISKYNISRKLLRRCMGGIRTMKVRVEDNLNYNRGRHVLIRLK